MDEKVEKVDKEIEVVDKEVEEEEKNKQEIDEKILKTTTEHKTISD